MKPVTLGVGKYGKYGKYIYSCSAQCASYGGSTGFANLYSPPPRLRRRRMRRWRRRRRCAAGSTGRNPRERRARRVGLETTFHRIIVARQNTVQLMTASTVHTIHLAPPGSDNPSRAYGRRHQLMTASMVHVTNLMTALPPKSLSPKPLRRSSATPMA